MAPDIDEKGTVTSPNADPIAPSSTDVIGYLRSAQANLKQQSEHLKDAGVLPSVDVKGPGTEEKGPVTSPDKHPDGDGRSGALKDEPNKATDNASEKDKPTEKQAERPGIQKPYGDVYIPLPGNGSIHQGAVTGTVDVWRQAFLPLATV